MHTATKLLFQQSDCPVLRSEVQVTRKQFSLDPCSCWRSSFGTGIQGKTFPINLHLRKKMLQTKQKKATSFLFPNGVIMPGRTTKHNNQTTITKTCQFKYTEKFYHQKMIFFMGNSDVFHISAQNIDCGYSLEPH